MERLTEKHYMKCSEDCNMDKDCACMKCSGIGSSSDRWEWRGAPEEGGKA